MVYCGFPWHPKTTHSFRQHGRRRVGVTPTEAGFIDLELPYWPYWYSWVNICSSCGYYQWTIWRFVSEFCSPMVLCGDPFQWTYPGIYHFKCQPVKQRENVILWDCWLLWLFRKATSAAEEQGEQEYQRAPDRLGRCYVTFVTCLYLRQNWFLCSQGDLKFQFCCRTGQTPTFLVADFHVFQTKHTFLKW